MPLQVEVNSADERGDQLMSQNRHVRGQPIRAMAGNQKRLLGRRKHGGGRGMVLAKEGVPSGTLRMLEQVFLNKAVGAAKT